MAAPSVINIDMGVAPISGAKVQLVYPSSELFVCNKNSKVAQTSPTDPNSIYNGDNTNDDNCLLFQTNGAPLLELFHVVAGTGGAAPAAVTTHPTIVAFGRVPRVQAGRRNDPARWSTTFPTLEGQSMHGYWWRPLYSNRDRVHPQSFSGSARIVKASTTGSEQQVAIYSDTALGGPPSYNLVGCDLVMVVVTTAAVGPAAGVIAGMLSNQ